MTPTDSKDTGRRAGIVRHGAGWQARVRRGRDNPTLVRQFPLETPLDVMQAWRLDTQHAHNYQRKSRPARGMFAADANRYLTLVTALPTYKTRVKHIQFWIREFAGRRRESITSADIRGIRDRLLVTPRAPGQQPLAPNTVNTRLRALSNLWTVLDGRRAPNPVRDVPEAESDEAPPQDLDYATIRQILAAMPDRGRPKDGVRPTVNLTKLRLTCMAFSGLPHQQLKQITPADLDLERGCVRVRSRKKGRGAQGLWLPLTPDAVAAFQAFHAANAYGSFSNSSMRQSFIRAAKHVTTEKVWPYRLRHSFGALAFLATGSLEAVGAMLQHGDTRTTLRYAKSAQRAVMTAHMAAVAARLVPPVGTTGARNLRKQAEISGASDRVQKRTVAKATAKVARKHR